MGSNSKSSRRSNFSWVGIAKFGVSALFLFWYYSIWSTTAALNKQLNTATDQYSAVRNLQVEYKNEIQEWKNLLLRSNSSESLRENWRTFETQYQKVAAPAQQMVLQSEMPAINGSMKVFVEAHSANFEQYKKSVDVFVKSSFDAHQADALVKGIDRPLLNHLVAADAAMHDEKASSGESLTVNAQNKIELSLLILAFISLVVIWMPKW